MMVFLSVCDEMFYFCLSDYKGEWRKAAVLCFGKFFEKFFGDF